MKTMVLKTALAVCCMLSFVQLHAFTAVTSGAWSSAATWGGTGPGATVSSQDIVIPNGITVSLDMNVSFSGVLNSFTIDGSLSSGGNYSLTLNSGTLAGSGSVDIERLTFSGLLTTTTFSGTMTLGTLMNEGSTITFTSLVTVSDTLGLAGGNTVLGSGANLTMQANSAVRVSDGTLTSTGGVFSTGNPYDVWYMGTSKNTGLELNSATLQDLHMVLNDDTQVLTLNMANVVVNGTLALSAGRLSLNGKELTINGNLSTSAGTSIDATTGSDLTIGGNGNLGSGLQFYSGSVLDELTLDRSNTGMAQLLSAVNISGAVHLLNGTLRLDNSSDLVMNAGSLLHIHNGSLQQNGGSFTGTASYDVQYTGISQNGGIELSGSGLNDVEVNLASFANNITLTDDVVITGDLRLLNGRFKLAGNDLEVDGTFDQAYLATISGDSTSDLALNLTAVTNDTLWFDATGDHLDRLFLNIPAGDHITLGSDLVIHSELNLANGSIDAGDYVLSLRNGAAITGYSDNDYVMTNGVGGLEMYVQNGAGFIAFPVGTMTQYAPAYISQFSSGTSGYFMVGAMPGVFTNGTSGYNSAATEPVVNNTWLISSTAAVVHMDLKLGWELSNEVNGFNRSQAFISQYFNNSWDAFAFSPAVSGANNTYEITRSGLTSTGPFAVADNAAILAIDEPPFVTEINIYPNPSLNFFNIEVSPTGAVLLYELFDAAGKRISSIQNSNTYNKFDLTDRPNGTYFVKITDIRTKAVTTLRITKSA